MRTARRVGQIFLAVTVAFIQFFTGPGTNSASAKDIVNWSVVGSQRFVTTTDILARFNLGIDNQGTPYVVYYDDDKGSVRKFDGEDWVPVGEANFFESRDVPASIAFDSDNTPYIAYRSMDGPAEVMKYNGSGWEKVAESDAPNYVTIAIDKNDDIYIAYKRAVVEGTTMLGKAAVFKLEGASWEPLGADSLSVDNINLYAFALDSKGMPYIFYTDQYTNKVTVKKFDGDDWQTVGTEGFASAEEELSIALDSSDTPYIFYSAANYALNVMMFNGESWIDVDSGEVKAIKGGYHPTIAIDSGDTPYVAYSDKGSQYKGTVKKFNGQDWENFGDPFTSGILPLQTMRFVLDPQDIPYVAFMEGESAFPQKKPRYLTVLKADIETVTAPVITKQPQSQAVPAGQTAEFTVEATDSTTLSYQWMKDGTNIPGAQSDKLTISNVGSSNAGNYSVKVSNAAGASVVSDSVSLSIYVPAIDANNKVSVDIDTVVEGDSVTLTAEGDRQSVQQGSSVGDERYIPVSWSSTEDDQEETFDLDGSNYKSVYTPITAGTYTLTATFSKEVWDGSAWKPSGTEDKTKTVTVTVNPPGGKLLAPATSGTVAAQPGSQSGTTKLTGASKGAGNHFVVRVSSSSIATPYVGDAAPTGSDVKDPYIIGSDISGVDAATNKYVALYEVDGQGKIVRFKLITLTGSQIKSSTGPTPGTTPSSPSAPTAPKTEEITVDLQTGTGETIIQTKIERTTDANGTVKDNVTLTPDRVQDAVDQLKNGKDKTARIVIPDEQDKVSEINVDVPAAAVAALYGGKANLEIYTENVRILIPSDSLDSMTDDLYFRLVPIKEENERKAVEERAKKEKQVREIAKDKEIKILGRPMTIETKMQSRPVTLILPLKDSLPQNEAVRKAILDNIVVFIEHSDGTKELIRGEIVTYKDGELGVQFDIDKFGTFTMVYIEGWKEYFASQQQAEARNNPQFGTHKPYIVGYPDGTFGPDKSVTRAEMASMLANNIGGAYAGNDASSFNDMTAKHWAFGQVETVNQAVLMVGYPDGSFGPEDGITRAEMAAIVYNWMKKHGNAKIGVSAGNDFTDVSIKQWAFEAIMQAQASGLVTGYGDSTFKPDQKLTRAEAVTILNRLFNRGPLYGIDESSFQDVGMNYWAFHDIEEAAIEHKWEKDSHGNEMKK